MKEMFEAYMRYGDLASEMMVGSDGVSNEALSGEDLDQLLEQYEWFSVAHILKARLTDELDYQTKLLLATGRCPFSLVKPTADIVARPTRPIVHKYKPRVLDARERRATEQVAEMLGLEDAASHNIDVKQMLSQVQEKPKPTELPTLMGQQGESLMGQQIQGKTQQEIQASEQAELPTKTSSTINMIDNFLSLDGDQLKIRPDEKTTTEDVSLNAIVAELDIVSEELAKIYLEQGYKNTAIEIYNKLSLLNPEKSVYFAELIEKIK